MLHASKLYPSSLCEPLRLAKPLVLTSHSFAVLKESPDKKERRGYKVVPEVCSRTRCQMGEAWKVGYDEYMTSRWRNWSMLWNFIASKIRKNTTLDISRLSNHNYILSHYTGWWQGIPMRGFFWSLWESRYLSPTWINLCLGFPSSFFKINMSPSKNC